MDLCRRHGLLIVSPCSALSLDSSEGESRCPGNVQSNSTLALGAGPVVLSGPEEGN